MQIRQYALYHNRKIIFNIGICIQDGSALHEGCRKFSDLLLEHSGGTLECNIHTILLSGNNRILLDMIESSSLDFIISDSYFLMPYTEDRIQVFDLPFLFDSAEEAGFVMAGDVGTDFAQQLHSTSTETQPFSV